MDLNDLVPSEATVFDHPAFKLSEDIVMLNEFCIGQILAKEVINQVDEVGFVSFKFLHFVVLSALRLSNFFLDLETIIQEILNIVKRNFDKNKNFFEMRKQCKKDVIEWQLLPVVCCMQEHPPSGCFFDLGGAYEEV